MSKERIKELIGIAVGEASMCWSEDGVFDASRAEGIVNRVCSDRLVENADHWMEETFKWQQQSVQLRARVAQLEEALQQSFYAMQWAQNLAHFDSRSLLVQAIAQSRATLGDAEEKGKGV